MKTSTTRTPAPVAAPTPTPHTLKIVSELHDIAITLEDCHWVAEALQHHINNDLYDYFEANARACGVARILSRILNEESASLLDLAEKIEMEGRS